MIENIINNIVSASLDMLNIVFAYVVLFGAKINKDKKRIIISYFAGIVSLIAGMLFIDSFDLYFTKVYWLIIPICWFTSRKKKWFALYPFIYNGTSIINICFSYVVAIVMNTSDAVVVVGGLGRLISESICVVILLIVLAYHKIRHIKVLEVMLSWQQYLVMFIGVFCAIILVGSVQWMTLGEKLPQIALNLYGFVVTIICLIFFVICLWQGIITNQRIKYKYENEKYEYFMRLQEEQVRNIVDKDSQIRKFRHDMRHHMTVLSTYANDKNYDAIIDYIEEIQQQAVLNSKISYTNDAAIDAIIGEFSELAGKRNIRFELEIRTAQIGIKSFDMCILLSNLFNNAIEACEKIEDIDKRFINVRMVSVDNFLQIVVKNSVDKKVIIKNNELITTKADKENHGIGSANIKDIVKKYNGDLQYFCDEDVFTSEVMLNM